jgi:hypothetical protein
MMTKTETTWWARIYMSGPIEMAKQVCRETCMAKGLCVTVEPTHFIYTGGEEAGYVVGLINYPRFPSPPTPITERAEEIARMLMERTYQHSALVMTPEKTTWLTSRE